MLKIKVARIHYVAVHNFKMEGDVQGLVLASFSRSQLTRTHNSSHLMARTCSPEPQVGCCAPCEQKLAQRCRPPSAQWPKTQGTERRFVVLTDPADSCEGIQYLRSHLPSPGGPHYTSILPLSLLTWTHFGARPTVAIKEHETQKPHSDPPFQPAQTGQEPSGMGWTSPTFPFFSLFWFYPTFCPCGCCRNTKSREVWPMLRAAL